MLYDLRQYQDVRAYLYEREKSKNEINPWNQPINLQPKNLQLTNFQPMSFQPMNLQSLSFEPINLQPMNLQSMNLQPMNSQPLNLQSMNFQPMSFQPMNSQPLNFQPMNLQSMNFQPTNSQPLNLQPVVFCIASCVLFPYEQWIYPSFSLWISRAHLPYSGMERSRMQIGEFLFRDPFSPEKFLTMFVFLS